MLIKKYCEYLINFYLIKNQFLKSAFVDDSSNCSKNITNSLNYAKQLHGFVKNHTDFVEDMKTGCSKGGNTTKCKIDNSGVDDILYQFDQSYYSYKRYPDTLCTSFAEFSNNEEGLFITG